MSCQALILHAMVSILMAVVTPAAIAQAEPNRGQAEAVASASNSLIYHLEKSSNPHIKPYAYALSTAIWSTTKIYVCWDNPSKAFEDDMSLVRRAISDTWEKYSALEFVGWQRCAKNNKGIRITIADVGPQTRGLGTQLQSDELGSQPGGMLLNLTFDNWSSQCKNNTQRTNCIRSIAIHEFGHAIGLSHEQNRPDAPGECTQLRQGPDGDNLLTPYDPKSVMNYCFNIYNPDLVLSDLDISAVRYLYGSESDKKRQE